MLRVAVPEGDLGGIGPELALAVCSRPETRRRCRPLLIGHPEALETLVEGLGLGFPLTVVDQAEEGFALPPEAPLPVLPLESPLPTDPPGAPAAAFGLGAVEGVLRGGTLCLEDRADLLLTPPVSKQSMHLAGYRFEGQTQILGELCGARRYGMLACSGDLRVLIATRHMSLRQALDHLDIGLVAKQIRIAHEAARSSLGIAEPRVVLAGLNPHAGEHGAFGREEERILLPAIRRAEEEWGYHTAGPAVPDMVFAEGAEGRWDVVIALYHDQAFIPLKLLGRKRAWTLFVGGGILRVSPMHGTAYDLVGSGRADREPFSYALERGLQLATRRLEGCSSASTNETGES